MFPASCTRKYINYGRGSSTCAQTTCWTLMTSGQSAVPATLGIRIWIKFRAPPTSLAWSRSFLGCVRVLWLVLAFSNTPKIYSLRVAWEKSKNCCRESSKCIQTPVVNTDDQRATPLAERRWKSGFGSNFKLLPPVSHGPVHFWDVSERCSKF